MTAKRRLAGLLIDLATLAWAGTLLGLGALAVWLSLGPR